MKRLLKCCAFVLGCIGAFIFAPALAYAGGQSQSSEFQGLLSSAALAPGVEAPEESPFSKPLPVSLDTWESEPLPLFPQQRMATQPPFIDWDKFELGGFVGVVTYSSDFKANPDIMGGIAARVPVPGIPGNWGLWTTLDAAGMTRDIPFFYTHRSGVWYSANIGADYTLTTSEIWLVRVQAGATYNFWNNLEALDNNFAGTVGLDIGFYWVKFNHRTTVNLNPQISFNGSNYYAILGLELQVQF